MEPSGRGRLSYVWASGVGVHGLCPFGATPLRVFPTRCRRTEGSQGRFQGETGDRGVWTYGKRTSKSMAHNWPYDRPWSRSREAHV